MTYAFAILILTAAVCYLLGFGSNRSTISRIAALGGTAIALVVALQQEGLQGTGGAIVLPDFMGGLGASFYASDALAAGFGAWCILVGGLFLLKLGEGERAA